MTASFADDRFAHLPLGDLQGIITLSKHGRAQQGTVLHERQICSAEIARINRSIDTMGEISLPFMSGSYRSASAVRDARTGSAGQRGGPSSSRSTSVQQSQQQHNNNAADDDPQARSESVAACSHEIQDAVKIVTTFTPSMDEKKKGPVIPWNVESRIKSLRVNEMYEAALSQRKDEKKDNAELRRPEFRKLAPLWNRHQHQKHRDSAAKMFSNLGVSPYAPDEEGNVSDFADEKLRARQNENKQLHDALKQQNAEHSLWLMQFAVGGSVTDLATAKKRDEDRKAAMKEAAANGSSTNRQKGDKKKWTFQVPSLLNRRNGESATIPAAAENEEI